MGEQRGWQLDFLAWSGDTDALIEYAEVLARFIYPRFLLGGSKSARIVARETLSVVHCLGVEAA